MWTFYVALLLAATSCISAQSQCQCGGFLTRPPNYSEWFYSFPEFFDVPCDDRVKCKTDCYNYLYNYTDGGDLAYVVPDEQMSVGDLICKQINRDIPTDTTVEFEYQLCMSEWFNTGLNTTYPFCCIDGQYPETGCPIIE